MKASKKFLIKFFKLPANNTFSPGVVFWIFAAVSLLGFSDAAYLAAKYLQGVAPPCSVLSGCETVTLSEYAKIAGIPVSVLGAAYYATLFVLALLALDTKKAIFFFLATRITIVGFLMSLYFIYVQLFVLKAVCVYCMASAFICFALFILALLWHTQSQKQQGA